MFLSLWTFESREFVDEWCTADFKKIPIEVVSSWQNMHQLAAERGQKIIWIKGKQLSVFCTKCNPGLYFVLLTSFNNGIDCICQRVLQIAVHLVLMMSDLSDCNTVSEYRSAVADCGWSISSLLNTATRPFARVPWALLSGMPENVLAHLSPLMKTCLAESLPTSMACLVSRERQLASSTSWDLLPAQEQICLTLFSRIHAPISDCIVRLVSQPNAPLYRLIQIELVPEVALLMLCGAQTSIDDLKLKVTQYWGPLMSELYSFQPENIQYAPLDSVPVSLCAFFQEDSEGCRCTSGYMSTESGLSPATWDEAMKRLFVRWRDAPSPPTVGCTVIGDRVNGATFVVSLTDDGHRTLILAFQGRIDGLEARSMGLEVSRTIDQWQRSNKTQ